MKANRQGGDFVAAVDSVAREVAAPAADEVDRQARFPSEAVEALRAEGALSALIPPALGGTGAEIGEVAEATTALARHCASTAMVFAMHHMQAACLARHSRSEFLHDVARQVCEGQLLLASATTELGVGGDLRTSRCAVDRVDGRFTLEKQAPVISYGSFADMVLATARRTPDSPPSDQVLVVCRPPGLSLEPMGDWDTLGFRGTVSPGFTLRAEGDERHVIDDPFGDILQHTMLPVSHILWSSVWLGLASAAVDKARQFVRAEARKQPGTSPPAAMRLAELMVVFQQMQALVASATRRYESVLDDPVALSGMGFAIEMNSLKVGTSTLVVDIVNRAMVVCGIAGYRQDSPYSLGRLVRDAHGAAVMVNNDRILANNAQMLLVHKED
ncbi:MAG TPA: acyl-CoA dehydrogenase family protein [Acidimicrobiales bacterium]|nr:acyl-CoA dehydrogenase family protein [Acidimicrobiales bacterium]